MSDVTSYPTAELHQVTRRITDGSHFSPTPCEHGYLIANVKDMKSGEIDFSTCTRISPSAYRELRATGCTIKNGNVLLSKDGTVGRVVVYKQDTEIGALSSICIIEPTDRLDAAFLGHALQSEGCLGQYDNFLSGSALRRLVLRDIRSIKVPLPDSEHQRTIAQVLDTLDTAIHETEAIIAKLKAVKQGLLHDLLTRGIDANGELRPPQPEAPHLYKKSLLGWIPKEWDVKRLVELLADVDPAMRSGPFGSALLKQEFVEVGVPLLGIDNVQTERFVASFTRFVTPRKFAELVRYAVRPNDLIITIMGTVGRCCLVPEDIGNALSSKHTWTISLNQDAYSPYLAMLQVNYSPWAVAHFASDQQGGTMAAIRSETLRSTLLPAPPREEQYLIEKRLRTLGRRIELEVDSLAKRYSEKAGLMDDLLTGRVSVKKLLLE